MSLIYPGGDQQVTPNIGLATWGMDEALADNMILIDTAIGSGGSAVTSVFGRTGAVIAEANDYAAVDNVNVSDTTGNGLAVDSSTTFVTLTSALNLGLETNNSFISLGAGAGLKYFQISNGGDISIVGDQNHLLTLSSTIGKIVVNATTELDLNATTVKINGTASAHLTLQASGSAELVAIGTINFGDLTNNLLSIDSGGGNISTTALNSVSFIGGSVSLALNASGADFNVNTPSGANMFINTGAPDIIFQAGPSGTVKVNTVSGGKFQVSGLQVFANNAAAITGGLVAGNFYRTGADPDVVCVVH